MSTYSYGTHTPHTYVHTFASKINYLHPENKRAEGGGGAVDDRHVPSSRSSPTECREPPGVRCIRRAVFEPADTTARRWTGDGRSDRVCERRVGRFKTRFRAAFGARFSASAQCAIRRTRRRVIVADKRIAILFAT